MTRSHTQDPKTGAPATLIAKNVSGSVLGFPQIDAGVSSHPDNWHMVRSSCEVMWMEPKTFRALWAIQI